MWGKLQRLSHDERGAILLIAIFLAIITLSGLLIRFGVLNSTSLVILLAGSLTGHAADQLEKLGARRKRDAEWLRQLEQNSERASAPKKAPL